MTAPARISQADIERAAKACKNAGWTGMRITLDLANQRIDIYAGTAVETPNVSGDDGWEPENV